MNRVALRRLAEVARLRSASLTAKSRAARPGPVDRSFFQPVTAAYSAKEPRHFSWFGTEYWLPGAT